MIPPFVIPPFNGHRAAITDERLSCGQSCPDDGEQIVRQVGDICDGLMLHLAVLPERSPEAGRNVNLALVGFLDLCDVYRAFVGLAHDGFVTAENTRPRKIRIFSGYKCNLIMTRFEPKPSFLPLEEHFGAVQVRFKV